MIGIAIAILVLLVFGAILAIYALMFSGILRPRESNQRSPELHMLLTGRPKPYIAVAEIDALARLTLDHVTGSPAFGGGGRTRENHWSVLQKIQTVIVTAPSIHTRDGGAQEIARTLTQILIAALPATASKIPALVVHGWLHIIWRHVTGMWTGMHADPGAQSVEADILAEYRSFKLAAAVVDAG